MSPRPYTIEEYTRTVCPKCAETGLRADDPASFIDGMLVAHDDAIWMRRFCPTHGEIESIYEEDAALWRARAGWQTPTSQVIPDRADNFGGFPAGYIEGLPASHGQHSCILLLNVTENCNFRCPTCYASALDPGAPASDKPTLAEMLHTVDTMIEREGGKLNVVMLSGGEPTLRRDLEALIEELSTRNVTRIMLNTNGRRIAKDSKFVEFLHRFREKVEVYLQFDGLTDRTYEVLRGEPLAAEKQTVLRLLNDAKIYTTLVMTVKRGVNDGELKDLFELGLATEFCCGIAFQPVFGSGRNSGIDPQNRITPTGVMNLLGRAGDFVPLPCSHRDCCDIAYFLKDGQGTWKSLVSLVGRDEMKRWIHLASNSISFENVRESVKAMIQDGTIQRVLSEQQKTSSIQLAWDLVKMCDCVPGVR
ncbi:MAG: radical SAM protein, partial [Armatimonadetes bacterium]|nr:radical SAM protein [Armatimonadota bacterium]